MKEIKIGRSKSNDIVINETSVSRFHASIFVEGGEIYVFDHHSTNGTYINGTKIRDKHALKDYDILKVGNALVQWKHAVYGKPQIADAAPDHQNIPMPAPVSVNKNQVPYMPPQRKSSAPYMIGGGIVLILLIILVFFTNTMPARWVKHIISPAKPSVISNSKENIPIPGFDYSFKVKAKIVNDGSDGYVKIITTIYECQNKFTDETTIKMRRGEIYYHEVVFDQVEFWNDCITTSDIMTSSTY